VQHHDQITHVAFIHLKSMIMTTTKAQVVRILILNVLFLIIAIHLIKAQGSPDALMSTAHVEGADHATVKIRSDGYSNDTSEIKFTNMDMDGTGTEFVIRSSNENGLTISSNSDLTGNTTDNIMTFEPSGGVVVGDLQGISQGVLVADEDGRLVKIGKPQFTMGTNLNTPDVAVNTSSWTPCGPTKMFVKDYDHTIIDAQFFGNVRFSDASSGINAVSYRVEVLGQSPQGWAAGKIYDETTWRYISSKTFYKNLPAGTYTVQVHARSSNAAANVFLDGTATIVIEER
jgi:hypothetical protein